MTKPKIHLMPTLALRQVHRGEDPWLQCWKTHSQVKRAMTFRDYALGKGDDDEICKKCLPHVGYSVVKARMESHAGTYAWAD